MNGIQILTLTIAIVFPALAVAGSIAALMYSNKRVDDLRTDSKTRFDDLKTEMNAMEKRLIQHIDNAFTHMELLLKLHEAEHHKKWSFEQEFMTLLKKSGMEYDARFVFG